MTLQALITFIVLIAALLVLATQRLRPDLTALLVTLTLVLAGILSPNEAFSAFGQPVIIIIPSIYVLGAALYETGVATMIADQILRLAPRNKTILTLVIMLVAGLLSAVVTSLLVVAVLMPAVLRVARKARLAPAQLLLPLATAATMGNTLTLIGAISNVVINDVLVASGQEGLGFFSLTPYGLVSLGVVVLWYLIGGQRLLGQELPQESERPSLQEVERTYQLDDQLYQLRVRSGSDLIGERIDSSRLRSSFRLNVVAVQPRDSGPQPARTDWVLERDDLLVVEGARGDVFQAASLHHLEPKGELPLQKFNELEEESLRLAEVMVPFRSQWVGKTLTEVRFRERYGLNVLAVQRQGEAIRNELPHLSLAIGDTLLVQGPVAQLRDVGQDRNLVLATYLGPPPGELVTSKARLTLAILGVMVISIVSGILSLATASLGAAVALILTGCLKVERAYESINGSVLILVGGMLPLALALDKTGVAELIAAFIGDVSQGVGPSFTLVLLYLTTTLMTQVISNTVTGALMTPIAVQLAVAQGLAPQPFVIAIVVAVTTSYVTPMTNGDNLLIREPGRYTTRDYVINGLPVFLLQTVALMALLSMQL